MKYQLEFLSREAVKHLAKYEHDRWVRWMLSEGWLPASVDDILLYKRAGAEKHQLHIAKMHPCICDWEELKNVEEDLSKELHKEIDFHSFDIESAGKTEQILRGAITLFRQEKRED